MTDAERLEHDHEWNEAISPLVTEITYRAYCDTCREWIESCECQAEAL